MARCTAYLPSSKPFRRSPLRMASRLWQKTSSLQSGNPDQFLKTHYASKSEKLNALLEHQEITFDLLPVFFRPNSVIYMLSANSEKPRCLRFDYGQVKRSNGKT